MDIDLLQEIQKATACHLAHAERTYALLFLANWFDRTDSSYPRPCVLHPHLKPIIGRICGDEGLTYEQYVQRKATGQLDATLPPDAALRQLERINEPAACVAVSLMMLIKEMNTETPEGVRGLIQLEERKAEVKFFYRESRRFFKEMLLTLDLDETEAEYLIRAWERDMQKAIAYDYGIFLPPQ